MDKIRSSMLHVRFFYFVIVLVYAGLTLLYLRIQPQFSFTFGEIGSFVLVITVIVTLFKIKSKRVSDMKS